VGQHNAAILRELGFDAAFVERLSHAAAAARSQSSP
jgi:hypothetical protein